MMRSLTLSLFLLFTATLGFPVIPSTPSTMQPGKLLELAWGLGVFQERKGRASREQEQGTNISFGRRNEELSASSLILFTVH